MIPPSAEWSVFSLGDAGQMLTSGKLKLVTDTKMGVRHDNDGDNICSEWEC